MSHHSQLIPSEQASLKSPTVTLLGNGNEHFIKALVEKGAVEARVAFNPGAHGHVYRHVDASRLCRFAIMRKFS